MALIVMTVAIGALPLFVQYGDYIFCTDFVKQQIPFIFETKRLLGSGLPFWSWNTYFGENFIGSYSFYTLTSPFVWINCLFPNDWLIHSIFFTLLLKYCCAFVTAAMYLRNMDVSENSACVGGLLYCFSSYTICNSFYYHFFEPIIVFPLLLLAIERYLREERYSSAGLLFASFLVVFINYYFAVASFLAALLYVGCRIVFSDVRIRLLRFMCAFLLVSAGILLDAVVLLPTYYVMYGNPRTAEGILTGLDFTALPYFLERMRNLFMPQIMEEPTSLFRLSSFTSSGLCLPVVGCIAAFVYCFRHPKDWCTVLLVMALVAYLTPINSVFTLFTNPEYTRWGYALTLFIILPTCRLLDNRSENVEVWHMVLYVCVAVVCCVVSFVYGYGQKELAGESKELVALFYISVFGIQLVLMSVCLRRRNNTTLLVAGIFLIACVQTSVFHLKRSDWYFAKTDSPLKGMVKTYTIENYLPYNKGSMQFRTWHNARHINLALLKNRPGIEMHHSIMNTSARRLITTCDSVERYHQVAFTPICNLRSFCAFMSVGEYVEYDDTLQHEIHEGLHLDRKCMGNGYTVYENKDFIPFGYTYDTYLPVHVLDSVNSLKPKRDVPLQMLANIIVEEHDETLFAKYLKYGNLVTENLIDSIIQARRKNVAYYFRGTTEGFTSKIRMHRENIVFYSVPAVDGFTAYVDGNRTEIFEANLGLSAIVVPEGDHEIEFRFIPPGLILGAKISFGMLLVMIGVFLCERRTTRRENNAKELDGNLLYA